MQLNQRRLCIDVRKPREFCGADLFGVKMPGKVSQIDRLAFR